MTDSDRIFDNIYNQLFEIAKTGDFTALRRGDLLDRIIAADLFFMEDDDSFCLEDYRIPFTFE